MRNPGDTRGVQSYTMPVLTEHTGLSQTEKFVQEMNAKKTLLRAGKMAQLPNSWTWVPSLGHTKWKERPTPLSCPLTVTDVPCCVCAHTHIHAHTHAHIYTLKINKRNKIFWRNNIEQKKENQEATKLTWWIKRQIKGKGRLDPDHFSST